MRIAQLWFLNDLLKPFILFVGIVVDCCGHRGAKFVTCINALFFLELYRLYDVWMEFTIIINVLNLHEIEYFEMTMKGIVVYTPFTCFCCMLLMVSTKPTKVAPFKNGGEIGIATKTLIQSEC